MEDFIMCDTLWVWTLSPLFFHFLCCFNARHKLLHPSKQKGSSDDSFPLIHNVYLRIVKLCLTLLSSHKPDVPISAGVELSAERLICSPVSRTMQPPHTPSISLNLMLSWSAISQNSAGGTMQHKLAIGDPQFSITASQYLPMRWSITLTCEIWEGETHVQGQ